jgi:hypothetical protein
MTEYSRTLSDGKYNVFINTQNSGRIPVAKFKLSTNIKSDVESGVSSGIISFLVVIILFGGIGFFLYRQYKLVQQKNQVCPHRLLESGRIKAKDVFVITNVDNRHHINIVMDLGKYLKVIQNSKNSAQNFNEIVVVFIGPLCCWKFFLCIGSRNWHYKPRKS